MTTDTDTSALVDPELVIVDLAVGDPDSPGDDSPGDRGRREVVEALTDRLVATGRVTDRDGFVDAVWAREQETGGTGMESGIAIPHAKHRGVRQASVAVARVPGGVDFGAEDAPADLVFLIAAPAGADDVHVTVLSKLARRLVHDDVRTALRQAPDAAALAAVLRREIA